MPLCRVVAGRLRFIRIVVIQSHQTAQNRMLPRLVELRQYVATPMQRVLRTTLNERNARFDLLTNVRTIGDGGRRPLAHQHRVQCVAQHEVHDVVTGVRRGAVEQYDDAAPRRDEGSHAVCKHV